MLPRIRTLLACLVITVLAFFIMPRVQAQPVANTIAVHQSHPLPPTAPHRVPMDFLVLGAAVGATRTTRRKAGAKREVPMFLDSEVHVMRENDDGKNVTTVVRGGVLVDDTDLTDEEIDELTARRVIRPATQDELDRLDRVDAQAQRAALTAEHETQVAQLRANTEAERSALVTKGVKPDDLVSFDEKASKKVADLQTKQAAALAKLEAQ